MRVYCLALALSLGLMSLPVLAGEDLSTYRAFHLEMDLPAIAALAGLAPTDAKVIYRRPAVIQELQWRPDRPFGTSTDPVEEVLFSFCDGALYRIVVRYDPENTEGLTNEDLITGISATYGTPRRPDAKIISSSPSQAYSDSEEVIARWEDAEHSFSLFRQSYRSAVGLLVLSKRLDALAQVAIVEAKRLNEKEAPQREIDRKKKEDDERRAAGEKVRPANKANFRP